MAIRHSHQDHDERALVALAPEIRRVVQARVGDKDTVDDLVQETLARVIEARPRLDDEALAPYAIATARNLANLHHRTQARTRRHAHRLIDLRDPERPEDAALRQEEKRAVALALTKLSERDRSAVVAHELMGKDTAELARDAGSTPGGVAAQLARARARLRVDYVLALRGMQPPTPKCRSVLVALSSGDRRRQAALDAGAHLMECQHCAAVSAPLMHRRRGLAALLPLPALRRATQWTAKQLRTPKGQVTATVAAGATAAAVAFLLTGSPESSSVLSVGGKPVPARAAATSTRYLAKEIRAQNAPVQSVPSDEGFWLGDGTTNRIWVELAGTGESPFRVKQGQKVSFTGKVIRHGPDFAGRVGVTATEGAALLARQGQHITVSKAKLRLER